MFLKNILFKGITSLFLLVTTFLKKNYQEVLGYQTLIPSIQLFKTHLIALGRADDTNK